MREPILVRLRDGEIPELNVRFRRRVPAPNTLKVTRDFRRYRFSEVLEPYGPGLRMEIDAVLSGRYRSLI
jgi:hypothetical protein